MPLRTSNTGVPTPRRRQTARSADEEKNFRVRSVLVALVAASGQEPVRTVHTTVVAAVVGMKQGSARSTDKPADLVGQLRTWAGRLQPMRSRVAALAVAVPAGVKVAAVADTLEDLAVEKPIAAAAVAARSLPASFTDQEVACTKEAASWLLRSSRSTKTPSTLHRVAKKDGLDHRRTCATKRMTTKRT